MSVDRCTVEAFIASDALTDEQRRVCHAVRDDPSSHLVVRACPGSGKTRTAAALFAGLAAPWADRRSGVAMLSFTNVACEQVAGFLQSQFGFPARPPWPHYLGTIDSFVNQYLFAPFGHIPMGVRRRPEVTHDGNTEWVDKRLSAGQADCHRRGCSPTRLRFTVEGKLMPTGTRVSCAGGKHECDAMKKRMVAAGFATPSDAMYWAMRCLELPGIARAVAARFPCLIVDEAQDTSEVQVSILQSLAAAGARLVLIGDPDQSIYEFNEACPELFRAFEKRWPSLTLSGNFRSSQRVCDATFAFSSLPSSSDACGPHQACSLHPQVIRYPRNASEAALSWFQGRLGEVGIPPSHAVLLARRNKALGALAHRAVWPKSLGWLTKATATAATERDQGDHSRAHHRLSHALLRLCFDKGSFGRDYEAIGTVGARPWRAETWRLLCELPTSDMHLSEWAPVVRDQLKAFLADLEWPGAGAVSRALSGSQAPEAAAPVAAFAAGPTPGGIACRTIHKAKGQEFDAVMVLCSPGVGRRRADLTCWLDPRDGETEEQRIGYVAMTRAKRLLVLAVPDSTPANQLDRLRPEFEIVE